jgi:predicted GIY-YIG superfamily endonuclease
MAPIPRRSPARAWWVYILQCGDGTLYTGIALDPEARLAQHREGTGARYTRGRAPLELVYQEAASGRAAASRREAAIKRFSRREKLTLIRRAG